MAAEESVTKPVRVAILGASGYTGAELVRMLLGHTGVEITVLTGNTQAGQPFSTVYPQFHYAKVEYAAQAEGRVAESDSLRIQWPCISCIDVISSCDKIKLQWCTGFSRYRIVKSHGNQ